MPLALYSSLESVPVNKIIMYVIYIYIYIYIYITWNKSDQVWLGLISFGPLQPVKKSDQVWLGLISFGLLQPAKKSDWVWLSLISFGWLQPAKESDQVWLGMIGFGWLKPAKKSDQVWLGLISFGQLQPERKVTSFDNYTCYNLYVLMQVWNTVSLSSLIILSKLHTLLEGSLVFFCHSQISPACCKSATSHRFNHWPLWAMASFFFLVTEESLPLSLLLLLSCFLFFYLSSFYSHAVSFHHVSSSSFPHISFSFHHGSFLEAWLELVMMTAWEVTHFVYFICKIFYLEKMWMVCIFQFWSALIGFDEVYFTVLSNILIEFDQLQLK